jgi:hypothetical protein
LSLGIVWELWSADTDPDMPLPREAQSPASSAHAAATLANAPPTSELAADALAGIAASIVERPLFSPDRRRTDEPATAAASGLAHEALPRLTGVLVGPLGGRAIFASADGKSHTAGAGDAIGGFKVRTIGPGTVIVTGSEGDRVLHPTYVASQGANNAAVPSQGANSAAVTSQGANSAADTAQSSNEVIRTRDRAR